MGKTDPRRNGDASSCGPASAGCSAASISSANATLSLRPIPPLEIDLIPRGTWTYGSPRWFDTVDHGDGSRTYYFGDLDSRELRRDLARHLDVHADLTLQAYAQLFLDGGHYGALSAVDGAGAAPAARARAPYRGVGALPPGESPDFRDGAINVNLVLALGVSAGLDVDCGLHPRLGPDAVRSDRRGARPACSSAGSSTAPPPTCSWSS